MPEEATGEVMLDEPKPERKLLVENLNGILNSEDYLKYLRGFDHEARCKAIGQTIEYGVIHPDLYQIGTHLDTLKEAGLDFSRTDTGKIISESITKSIAAKLGLGTNLDDPEVQAKIFDYYVKNVDDGGVFYHGFNGSFEDQIKAQGLKAEDRMWDWKELERIHEIAKKAGWGMLLGWGMLNSQSKISYSHGTDNLYRYAVASPEWFAQFTAEGWHVKLIL